ncbi:hypothetical protein D3C81_1310150 [compost metagenome]
MGEKNILAYFKSPEEAEGVARKLNSLRAIDVSIERFSGSVENNSSLDFSNSIGILAASNPTASGMSHGGQGGPTGHDILLTAVVDESIHHQALRIVEEMGGRI